MRDCWTQTLAHFESSLPPHTYNTWLRPLQCRAFENGRVLLEAPNAFYRDRVANDYGAALAAKLRELSGDHALELAWVVPDLPPEAAPVLRVPPSPAPARPPEERPASPEMTRTYTFESFVVGTSNQFAHAATLAAATNPGRTYNPLFIYGGVGLGKTHLLCALGNRILAGRPNLRIVYRSAEQFTNEMINAIRFEKTEQFRCKYRQNCDVLLLDDVHFLSKKERTQEEFFHTFNVLHQANKQIAMTSDRLPNEIPDLDERLRSRFQWGLFCDIQPPDVETRVAILRKKAEASSLLLPDDVAMFLASQIKSNVRVLEGALIRISAHASLSGRPITLELARELFPAGAGALSGPSAELIQRRVAEFFNLNVSDLKSPRRHKVVALPRQIAMYLTRKLTGLSYPEIGERFGGKDHTTVIHGVAKIERLLEQDTRLKTTLAALEQAFSS